MNNIKPLKHIKRFWYAGCGKTKAEIDKENEENEARYIQAVKEVEALDEAHTALEKEIADAQALKDAYREAHPSNQPLNLVELISDLFVEVEGLKRELVEHLEQEHSLPLRHLVDMGYVFDRDFW